MKAPDFWYSKPGIWSALLAPLAAIWTYGAARRQRRGGAGARPGVPVICVGNINVGGSGKTPTVIALIEKLGGSGVHVVSRGYGGTHEGPLRVDERVHRADEVGDEPLLLAAFAPVWVAHDRAAGARAAVEAGAEVILLDDGFQDPVLAKDLSIAVVDAAVGFGNGRVLPAGPLREPVAAGLARADVMLVIGNGADRAAFLAGNRSPVPVAEAEIQPLETGMDWSGARVLAFAGIGRPQKFFATLAGLGAEVVRAHGFADHAPYRRDLLARLEREARQLGAQMVTTEKDAARLPPEFRRKVLALPVRLRFCDDAALTSKLAALTGR